MKKTIPAPIMRRFVELAAGTKLAPWQIDALARHHRAHLSVVIGGKAAEVRPG